MVMLTCLDTQGLLRNREKLKRSAQWQIGDEHRDITMVLLDTPSHNVMTHLIVHVKFNQSIFNISFKFKLHAQLWLPS